jgi:hypothetical protein
MDKVQKTSNSKSYTPLSELFKIYMGTWFGGQTGWQRGICFLRCNVKLFGRYEQMFRRNLLSPSARHKMESGYSSKYYIYTPNYMTSYPIIQWSSQSSLWEFQFSHIRLSLFMLFLSPFRNILGLWPNPSSRTMTLGSTEPLKKFEYWGVGSNWVYSTLRPPIGLLCQPRVIMEKLVK